MERTWDSSVSAAKEKRDARKGRPSSAIRPTGLVNLGRPAGRLASSLTRTRTASAGQTQSKSGCLGTRSCFTPYWTTFELPAIDMKAASVGILDRIVAGPRWWSLRKSRGGSLRAITMERCEGSGVASRG